MESAQNVVYLQSGRGRGPELHGPINRYSLLIPLCVLGILVANAYSLMITNNGLLISNVFPDLHVFDYRIPQSHATFIFASVLQFGILVLYLLFAASRPGHKLLLLPFLLAMVSVSFYFGFLSVHSNARGDSYVASLTKRIDNLSSGIGGEQRFIATSVEQALEGHLKLAEASKRGHDKTGVAACGPLCSSHYDRAEAIRSKYGHLLEVQPAAPPASEVRAQWRDASALYADYVNRARDYDQFLREQGSSSAGYAVSPAIAGAYDSLRHIFGKGMDDRWMLTARSLADIDVDVGVGVSALISIMPDIINIALALTISALLALSRQGVMNRRVREGELRRTQLERQEPVLGSLPVLSEDPPGIARLDPGERRGLSPRARRMS